MNTIAVVDYGMGNLHSVAKALERVGQGAPVRVTYDPQEIAKAARVVFPGVGAMKDCVDELRRLELDAVLKECAATRPFLGICVGMQALFDWSEENGGSAGLGILAGRVRRFQPGPAGHDGGERIKVPHMGWNAVHQTRPHPLWEGIAQDTRFYFVHSYYCEPAAPESVAGTTVYGQSFVAAVARGKLFAVQFHPEKSQHAGLALLANFVAWDGSV
ncbi:MAG TPA: imidazole glycerol phosphate synthase subunit HisH [Gammaproteobacteria bacterium]|nr:imidazole glycerol phosphate synthase subunit HisH [Gammaproteobacteria bacterium]